GFRVSNKFTFAFYGDDLDTQAGQDDKDWHHWSCTYDASSRLRCIYRDGTKIASDKAAGPYLGEGELTIGRSDHHYFDGDLADLRIWSCARTEAEVKANLNARLSGREFELMASWPLLSVEEDRTRNRVAQGPEIKTQGLYSSRRTLHRLLKDGNTPAVNFESRTFVAAVERSTYSETLEFKGDASGIEFLYWGKAIGGAQSTKVPVKATVVALDNGWKRASARFTAPRGFTHLRAFDMRVLGVWTKLMVRNHKLQRLQSTVTERTYTETLTLPVVAADHAAKERGRQALSRDEREIARLRKEHAIREAALARSPEQNTQVIDNKRKQVTALETKVTAVTAHRSLMERHLTYGGALAIRGNNGKNNRYLTVEGTSVRCNRSIVGGAEKFVIHDAQNPSSEDVVRYGDWVGLRGYTGKYLIAANPSWPHSHYYWVGAEWPHIKNYEKFTLLNPNDLNDRSPIYASGAIALMTNRRDHGQKFVRTSTGGAWWERVWCEGSSIEPGTRW
ncbi:MAG: LamG-like jellyroll fold domain-containing protein, partial [Nannocystaceae bacterium]